MVQGLFMLDDLPLLMCLVNPEVFYNRQKLGRRRTLLHSLYFL